MTKQQLTQPYTNVDDKGWTSFCVYWDAIDTTCITGVEVSFLDPTTATDVEKVKIFIESEAQQYRNNIDYSIEKIDQTKYFLELKESKRLEEDENIIVDWQKRLKRPPHSVTLHADAER